MSLSIKQKQILRYTEQNWNCLGGEGWGTEGLGVWNLAVANYYIHRVDKQQGSTV